MLLWFTFNLGLMSRQVGHIGSYFSTPFPCSPIENNSNKNEFLFLTNWPVNGSHFDYKGGFCLQIKREELTFEIVKISVGDNGIYDLSITLKWLK